MKLTELRIQLKTFGKDQGSYFGKAEFTDRTGDIALKLNPEMCEKIFLICADGLIDVAKEAAQNMTCNIIEHKKSLIDNS